VSPEDAPDLLDEEADAMKGYIDLFLLPVPKKQLRRYRSISTRFGRIMLEHGATEYREFVGDDLKVKGMGSFLGKIRLKPGEVLVSAVIGFRSKAQRDRANKGAMADPRAKPLMAQMEKDPIVDMKRMLYGGFATIVKP
jgi:uncharacterized protein YbaA (DUF1428 family)